MRLLAFSDLHRSLEAAAALVERSADADVVVGVGDFAVVHRGLEEVISVLREIEQPIVLVPGNNETDEALRQACAGWERAIVLHGEGAEIEGVPFFGLGCGVPITPWDWSFDLSEEAAAEMLVACPEGAVLASHSPPKGHVDTSSDATHLGSESVLRAIEAKHPRVVLCGHIHESWTQESSVGETRVLNVGPNGILIDV
jgi:Icc-related predicted phosphoesterase